ncbi:isoprenyl transferase [Haliovirga abyssi]|uniref:Isoprenyl transferase n=1 Tax=Haliovirga abyssi TaxID=2996794 RepID=A0AAU9DWM9_9FUSO|nr:isoprenyl transferase [Haliovirga abyssi]BDU49670.1 isoprenyl transferase [Haliovirga abyssi]
MEIKKPKHIAIIMDGNGRWAKKRMLPRTAGHNAGVKTVRRILKAADKYGIKYLTLYAFSTENWKRPQKEVDALMHLFHLFLNRERKKMMKDNVKLIFSGIREGISEKLLILMDEVVDELKNNSGIVLNIAFNYGGRREIIDAINLVLKDGKKEITEENFKKYLYHPEIPEPELVIRTSGEFRISNFLLWEIAYSEFYITKKLWPDFKQEDLLEAINVYMKRERRFGGV